MGSHVFNPSTREVEAGVIRLHGEMHIKGKRGTQWTVECGYFSIYGDRISPIYLSDAEER